MRFVTLALVSFLVAGGLAPSADKTPAKQEAMNKLTTEKLKAAHVLLEALARDDYEAMVKSSEELIRVSKATEWTAYKTHEYELQTNKFRSAAETLVRKAKAKNTDGATLAYMDLTMACVRCHQHCRENRNTSLDGAAHGE